MRMFQREIKRTFLDLQTSFFYSPMNIIIEFTIREVMYHLWERNIKTSGLNGNCDKFILIRTHEMNKSNDDFLFWEFTHHVTFLEGYIKFNQGYIYHFSLMYPLWERNLKSSGFKWELWQVQGYIYRFSVMYHLWERNIKTLGFKWELWQVYPH